MHLLHSLSSRPLVHPSGMEDIVHCQPSLLAVLSTVVHPTVLSGAGESRSISGRRGTLPLSLFVCLFLCLSACLSVCLSHSLSLSVCLYLFLSVCLSLSLSLSLSLLPPSLPIPLQSNSNLRKSGRENSALQAEFLQIPWTRVHSTCLTRRGVWGLGGRGRGRGSGEGEGFNTFVPLRTTVVCGNGSSSCYWNHRSCLDFGLEDFCHFCPGSLIASF